MAGECRSQSRIKAQPWPYRHISTAQPRPLVDAPAHPHTWTAHVHAQSHSQRLAAAQPLLPRPRREQPPSPCIGAAIPGGTARCSTSPRISSTQTSRRRKTSTASRSATSTRASRRLANASTRALRRASHGTTTAGVTTADLGGGQKSASTSTTTGSTTRATACSAGAATTSNASWAGRQTMAQRPSPAASEP